MDQLSAPSTMEERAFAVDTETKHPMDEAGATGDCLNLPSWFPAERRMQLIRDASRLLPELRAHRADHLATLKQLRKQCDAFSAKTVPAWVRLSPTASDTGSRLIIGLRDNTCAYRDEDPLRLGCLNCGYYAGSGADRSATDEELMLQVRAGFSHGFTYRSAFDVVEFLGDGSFLNDEEVNIEAQEAIFDFVAEIPYVKRILVESRPEYLTNRNDKLAGTLNRLRPDQELEIGIGLETADDFVRTVCINKGFSLTDFETATERIAKVNRQFGNRCALVAYMLVKPALLSPAEAVQDAVETLRQLARISKVHGVRIVPKLEPAAVAVGTVLSLLHSYPRNNRIHYAPLNYWAILEILTRAYLDEECQHIFKSIRIGGREDMDDVLKLPAVYSPDGRYDQFDFVLYDAIQGFNQHSDLFRLYATLRDLYPGGVANLLSPHSSLNRWVNEELNGDECSIVRFLEANKEKVEAFRDSSLTELEEEFKSAAYWVLDLIEGHSENTAPLEEVRGILRRSGPAASRETRDELSSVILECFRLQRRQWVDIDVPDVVQEPDGFVRVFFEAKDFVSGKVFDLWAGIPLTDDVLSSSAFPTSTF